MPDPLREHSVYTHSRSFTSSFVCRYLGPRNLLLAGVLITQKRRAERPCDLVHHPVVPGIPMTIGPEHRHHLSDLVNECRQTATSHEKNAPLYDKSSYGQDPVFMPGTNLNAKYGGDTVIATDFYNDRLHLPKYVRERDERREDRWTRPLL